jgi:hypothetical protein
MAEEQHFPTQPLNNVDAKLHLGIKGVRRATMADLNADEGVSRPTETNLQHHVVFNEEKARYEDLPEEMLAMNTQFGMPLAAVPKIAIEGYESTIPAVLEMLRKHLVANGTAGAEFM